MRQPLQTFPYSSLSIFTGSSFVIPMPLKNAVTTAQTRMIAAVKKIHTGDVLKLFCLIPKDESPSRISWLENR